MNALAVSMAVPSMDVILLYDRIQAMNKDYGLGMASNKAF